MVSRCRRALRWFSRFEPGFSKDPLPLEALVILTSDFLKLHRLLDAAIRNTEDLRPRRHCALRARIRVSGAERDCKRCHNPGTAAKSTTQSWPACWASTSNSCRCSCPVSKPLAQSTWRCFRHRGSSNANKLSNMQPREHD